MANPTPDLSAEDRETILHSLGLTGGLRRWAYRNYFAADPANHQLARLSAAGLMGEYRATGTGALIYYRVTIAGMRAAGVLHRVPKEHRHV